VADSIRTNFHAMQLLQAARIYQPAVVPGLGFGGFYVFSAMKVLGHGETIEAAMVAAGLWPLPFVAAPLFFANEFSVMNGEENVCIAKSKTYAKRIANALNAYAPDERGK
jgi:hypothetical protein